MEEKYYLTKERFEELKKELDQLKLQRIDVAERLKKAKEYGDLSENAEYTEAKEAKEQLENRIFESEQMIKTASIIKKSHKTDAVYIGSTVVVKKEGKTLRYTIVGSNEANPSEGKISNESPLGKIFLGKKVGETVTLEAPAGKIQYKITDIE